MPGGQEQDWSGWYATGVDSQFMRPTRCPEIDFISVEAKENFDKLIDDILKAYSRMEKVPYEPPVKVPRFWDLDYIFVGAISASRVTGKTNRNCEEGYEPCEVYCWGGDLIGSFSFTLKLMDHHHGEIVKEDSVSWTGKIHEALGFWRADGTQDYMVKRLANTFNPLDKLIKDYERIPESCRVEMPKDKIQAGQNITIHLTDIKDSKGRQTQWWQRVIVRVDKGKILNGESTSLGAEDERVFKVGREGVVEVRYQAPSECKNATATITIHNTCEKKESSGEAIVKYDPVKEIAKKTFDIVCDRWEAELTLTQQATINQPNYHGGRRLTITLKALLRPRRSEEQSAVVREPALKKADEIRKALEEKYKGLVPEKELAKAMRALEKLKDKAEAVGGLHSYASEGAQVSISDRFNGRQIRSYVPLHSITEEWNWSTNKSGFMGLNIGLNTNTPKARYSVFVGTKSPEGRPQDELSLEYQYQASRKSVPPDPKQDFRCEGTNAVKMIANLATLFVKVPKEILGFSEGLKTLNGSYTWSEGWPGYASQVANDAFGPECKESNPWASADSGHISTTNHLKWTIKRVSP